MQQRFKLLRKALGLSQEEFANKLGLTRGAITNIELGKTEAKPLFISLVCSTFNVNEGWLRTGEGEMFNEMSREEQIAYCFGDVLSEPDDSIKKSLILELVSALAKMDNSDWDAVEEFIIRVYERSHRSPPNKESG